MKKIGCLKSLLIISVFIFGLQGCGQITNESLAPTEQNSLKFFGTSTGNPNNGDLPAAEKIDFAMVSEQVFQPNCVSCHGAQEAIDGIRYDTYESAIATGGLSNLQHSYQNYQEPAKECGPISKENMDLVALWIQMGAPRESIIDSK